METAPRAIPNMNLFSLIINNKWFILQPSPEGGLDKGIFMLYICKWKGTPQTFGLWI